MKKPIALVVSPVDRNDRFSSCFIGDELLDDILDLIWTLKIIFYFFILVLYFVNKNINLNKFDNIHCKLTISAIIFMKQMVHYSASEI